MKSLISYNSHPRFQRIANYLQKLRYALFLILVAVLIGVIGFVLLEGYTLSEAFYMTIITLSTVGFSEVKPLDFEGRIFTSFLIIFNLGTFAYAASTISSFFIEGNFLLLLKDYNVFKKIKELEDHVIICGSGRHGREVMEELKKQNIAFVIIEKEHDKVDELRDERQALYLDGDATHDEILEEAGIRQARSLITVLGEDTDNLFVVLSARQLNPKLTIISRAINEQVESKLRRAGANHVVRPERIGGFYMATLVSKPDAIEFFNMLSNMGSVQIDFEEVSGQELKAEYQDKTIRELNIRGLTGANVIGIHDKQGRYIINPPPDTFIRHGAKLVILGDGKQMQAFRRMMMK